MIRDLVDEINEALGSGLYRVALLATLTVPDIAGALDASNGQASKASYVEWFDMWAAPRFHRFGTQVVTGEDCYQYRCVLLHQGRGSHPASRYEQSVFVLPKPGNIVAPATMQGGGGSSVVVDVPHFCEEVVAAAWDWLDKVEDSELFRANSEEALSLFGLSFRAEGHAGPAHT